MLGTVGVMHLEADDLAAVEVEDQVEVKPASLDLCRQERHVPAPDLAGTGGDVRGRRARCPRRLGAAAAVHLTMRAQHAMEARIHWRCRSPRRPAPGRCAPAGFRRSGVRWPPRRSGRVRLASTRVTASAGSRPAAGRPGQAASCFASAGRCAGRSRPARRLAPAARHRRGPRSMSRDQGLAIFQAGHASSPSWKIAWSFFDSTSKAAVSAKRLVLAAQLALQFLDPAALLPGRQAVLARFAETRDRVALPGVQRGREHTMLAAPGAARGLVQPGGGDDRFQPCRRCPAMRLLAGRARRETPRASAPASRR